jgi:hypothetical protein
MCAAYRSDWHAFPGQTLSRESGGQTPQVVLAVLSLDFSTGHDQWIFAGWCITDFNQKLRKWGNCAWESAESRGWWSGCMLGSWGISVLMTRVRCWIEPYLWLIGGGEISNFFVVVNSSSLGMCKRSCSSRAVHEISGEITWELC